MPHGWRTRPSHVRAVAQRVAASARRLRPFIERRKLARVKSSKLGCNLGIVMDLSAGGMRLRSRRRLYDLVDVELSTRSEDLTLRAKVIWTKKLTFRKYEIGLRFLDLTPQLIGRLNALAVHLEDD